MIAIDENGNLIADKNGNIARVSETEAPLQNFISETRCVQGTFAYLPEFGLNPAVWYLSQSPRDRVDDLIRISKKYLTVRTIQYNEQTRTYNINI